MPIAGDLAILAEVEAAVTAAGDRLRSDFSIDARPADRDAILAATEASDKTSLSVLRPALEAVRPGAGWVEDELDSGTLPPGEWWVTDPVEGNINFIHGLRDWCVTATLVRDGAPVLTAVRLPLTDETYSAVRGGGAHLNGRPLHVSSKTELKAAHVGTGQASPREDHATRELLGRSATALLQSALVVQVSVPATLQLIHVAAGRRDVFWQHSQVRSGLAAGALLVAEAGGAVTDLAGAPWDLAASDFLAAAPGLHAAALQALSAG